MLRQNQHTKFKSFNANERKFEIENYVGHGQIYDGFKLDGKAFPINKLLSTANLAFGHGNSGRISENLRATHSIGTSAADDGLDLRSLNLIDSDGLFPHLSIQNTRFQKRKTLPPSRMVASNCQTSLCTVEPGVGV